MITPYIRWMFRRDMDEILDIENQCFQWDSWTEKDFVYTMRQRNVIGMVAEYDEQVVGFSVYEFHKKYVVLLNVAVLPELQRQGIGKAMIAKQKQKQKLSLHRRERLQLTVDETNLAAQLFFRSQGFKATGIDRDPWGVGRDAYKMAYRHRKPARKQLA